MRNILCYVKGLYHTVPITTQLKECMVSIYPERIEYRIPFNNSIKNIKTPILVIENDKLVCIFTDIKKEFA